MRLGRLGLFLAQRRRAAGPSEPRARGVVSASEVGTAVFASMAAPAATGVESASEVGAAVFMGMSAPAATGVESASEVGDASPPSADTTAPVMTSDSYDEGTTTFSATITETESLPVTMHVLVSATEPTTADDIINGTGLFKTTYTVAAGANSDELEFSTVAAGTHWLGILPVDAADNSDFAQAHVAEYTFPGGYVATGVESTSEVGTAAISGVTAPAATGVESTSEVGSAAVPGVSAPAATGVESASEVGTASVSSISAPAATGVESASEVGTPDAPAAGSTLTYLGSASDTSSASTLDKASVSVTSGNRYVVLVANTSGSPTAVTGGSVSATQRGVDAVYSGRTVQVWDFVADTTGSITVSASLPAYSGRALAVYDVGSAAYVTSATDITLSGTPSQADLSMSTSADDFVLGAVIMDAQGAAWLTPTGFDQLDAEINAGSKDMAFGSQDGAAGGSPESLIIGYDWNFKQGAGIGAVYR